MSYILEALRRAEQERALGRVPDPAALVAPVASPRRRRFPPWLIVTLALLLNAGVLFAIFGVNWKTVAPAPASSAAVPVTAPSAPSPVPVSPIPAPPPAPVPPPPAAVAPSVPIAAVPSDRPAGKPEAVAPSAPVAAVTSPAVPVPAAIPPPPARTPKVETPAAKSPEPVARSRPPAESATPSLPGIEATSGLNLNIHVYSEVRNERFVMINSRRYKEGERLTEGPVVESIQPDGVVLSERGKRFLLEVPR